MRWCWRQESSAWHFFPIDGLQSMGWRSHGTGYRIGGAFLRAENPQALYAWYEKHLGIVSRQGCFVFPRETQRAYLAVAFFPKSSDDLDGVLDKLSAAGVSVDPSAKTLTTGDLGGVRILRENRIELWQPPQ
jgi:hypothetical protein